MNRLLVLAKEEKLKDIPFMKQYPGNPWETFMMALGLGLRSFGGPTAHIGYFHQAYVRDKAWVDEETFKQDLALSQFLPGPASSQLGMAIAWHRAGPWGALSSWLGFTLPSAILMACAALFMHFLPPEAKGLLQGLKLVAFAVLSHAMITMAKSLLKTPGHVVLAVLALLMGLLIPWNFTQMLVIVLAGTWGFFSKRGNQAHGPLEVPTDKLKPLLLVLVFFMLLFIFPLLRGLVDNPLLALTDIFYRAGALVFGGGHVVLPLLKDELIGQGLVSPDNFMAAYALAQSVPGPLFTLSTFIGMDSAGLVGAVVATLAIFLPAYLIILGVLPLWSFLSKMPRLEGLVAAINAAVVGLLALAWYNPVFTGTIHSPLDLILGLGLGALMLFAKWPSWIILLLGAGLGFLASSVLP